MLSCEISFFDWCMSDFFGNRFVDYHTEYFNSVEFI